MCRIFHDAIPCLPLWTSFPHPRYPTLNGLMDRLNHLGNHYVNLKVTDISIGLKVYYDQHGITFNDHRTVTKINPDGTYNITERTNVLLSRLKQKVIHILPSLLFIADGVHDVGGEFVTINIPISIIGESREHCIVMGGLKMNGKKEDDVNVSDVTLRNSMGHGVWGYKGASFHLDNVSVENSGQSRGNRGSGVFVRGTKRSTMKNCNVSHSNDSGLALCFGGLMTIDGNGTTIHHNCTGGGGRCRGLDTCDTSSSIHLVSPLKIEMISTNNEVNGDARHFIGGGDYGGFGTIAIVDNEGTIIKIIREAEEYSENDY